MTISIKIFLVFLFLSVSSFFSSANFNVPLPHAKKQPLMASSEAETLFKIMDSMSDDKNWKLLYPNPCEPPTWPGIECKIGSDNHLHVTRLDFGNHPNPSCKNTAVFPYEIFSLPNLESIFFFNCFIHSKTTLSVSQNRLSNSTLQQLSLRANPSLVGSIPPQISSLKSLKILTLSQNSLVGKIPVGVFSLSSLVHLDLSYNMLTGSIPFQLGNLKNLVGLDLSYNSLVGMIPTTIGEMGQLQKLDLSSNSLVGTIPDSVEKLSSLMFMALSNNKLEGNFPKGISKLQSLQNFIMDDNPMKIPLPLEFGNLSKLQELRLANSGYFGTIPQNYALLMNLTTLSLQNNRLTGQIPTTFSGLSHIYHLNLSKNLLFGVVPFDASFLKRLGRNLDLSGNPDLCLNPTEANYSVKLGIGVNICGKNKMQPLKSSSQASQLSFCKLLFTFSVLSMVLF